MRLAQKAESLFDFPDGSISGEARVEIDGFRQLSVDGACDILEYEETYVRMKTKSGELRVHGDSLVLSRFHVDGAIIRGRLLAVEFS